jgi:hypothetical protein
VDAPPRWLLTASRLLFVLSGVFVGSGLVCIFGGLLAAAEIAARLLDRVMAEIDPDTLATLPPGFLTPATVERAAVALGSGLLLLGAAQLATSMGLRRGQRWSYAAAVIGGLFIAFTAGATALFMVVAIPAQPQAALPLAVGAALAGAVAVLYAVIAVFTAIGRRALEAAPA